LSDFGVEFDPTTLLSNAIQFTFKLQVFFNFLNPLRVIGSR
jgi:hypothetical protein